MTETEKKYEDKKAERRRINLALAECGVEFFDLESAQIDEGIVVGAGTFIGPGVIVTGATVIGENCVIEQGSRIENSVIAAGVRVDHSILLDCMIGAGTTVGPFAYIRPGTNIGAGCRIGDYVEIKNSNIGPESKVSHLAYVGDADIGASVNIGCGVVFVNYDGQAKHRSSVGDGTLVGCNVNIVSPVNIGAGAYVAAGGTVTEDVPDGALFIGRDRGRNIDGWVEKSGLLSK